MDFQYFIELFFGGLTRGSIYALIALAFIVVGSVQKVDLVWDMSDMFNGLMVIPNLIAVFLLSGVIVKLTKEYFAKEN